MAPEQYTGGIVDHRCDIHASGAVLYELLTGSPPYAGSAAEVMYKVCHEVPKLVSTVNPALPKTFDRIVSKALEKDAANRYACAGEFQDALRSSWNTMSSSPPSPILSDRARMLATVISRQPVAPLPPADAGTLPLPGVSAGVSAQGQGSAPNVSRPSGNLADSGSLAAWSKEQLAEIERQLMPIVGPMARILVRHAAQTTASRQELYRLLARRLKTSEERRRFLQAGRCALTDDPEEPPGSVSNSIVFANIAGRPLTAEATERASQLLARYLGPIALVMARKAAQTACDEAHLYSMLAENLTDAAERERFITEARSQR
jgi:serine/threonine protein kinase